MIDYTSGTDDNVVADDTDDNDNVVTGGIDGNDFTDDTDCNEKSGAKFLPSLRSIIAAFLAGNARCS